MPDSSTFVTFALASLAVLAIPGPTMLYIVARTAEEGRDAGLISAVGVGIGTLVHVALAAAGVSALLASSASAMTLVQVGGAAYLLWMGVGRLRRPGAVALLAEPSGTGRSRLLWQGVLMDALNPKTAIFFLAFLPQFVDPAAGAVPAQVLLLGLCFVALAAACDAGCALAADAVRARLAPDGTGLGRVDRITGVVLIGLSAFVLFSGAH